MTYQNKKIATVAGKLEKRLTEIEDKAAILRAPELRSLYAEIPTLDPKDRASFGKEINQLKNYLEKKFLTKKDR